MDPQSNPELDRALRRTLGGPAPDAVHQQARSRFADFAAPAAASASGASHRGSRWWWWLGSGLAGSAVATVTLLFLIVAPSPTWAQVAAKFRTLRYFNATVFVTDAVGQPPERIDLWVAPDNRLRAHYRDLIFFGADGRIERVLSAASGETISLAELQSQVRPRDTASQPRLPALAMVENIARMSESAELSLDQLLSLLRSRRDQLTPAPNAAPDLSEDLEIFDLASDRSPEWARLWVLRRLELPLRLRVWNAANAGQIEVLFDYTARLPDSAFDAGQVASSLTTASGPADRLYAGLAVAGERPLTPAALLASRAGLPMPEIDSVGRTAEGVVWVLSRRADNPRPDGELVAGWDALTDSLGQTYVHQLAGSLPAEQMTLEFFVPENLGSEFRLPSSYALQCRARGASGVRDGTVLGTRAVTQWNDRSAIPDLQRAVRNQLQGRTHWALVALDEAAEHLEWEDFEQLAAQIPGEPENDPVALARELKRVGCYLALRRNADAARLSARLYPLLNAELLASDPAASAVVCSHIAQLYRDGQRDLARKLANRHVEDAVRRSRIDGPAFVVSLLVELRAAGLTDEAAHSFLDRHLIELPAVQSQARRLDLFGTRSERTPRS